mmetsp:Transcript_33494/g.95290  ORF Transcript_33494/g.95290 Transcript_33494/m.95290 type:complete len:304 (-) Transcript_33494:378-1289(-)
MPPTLPAQAERGHDAVEEDAARAADPDLLRAALARRAGRGVRVPAAEVVLLLRGPAQDADEPALAPERPPRILDLVVVAPIIGAEACQHDRVVHHGARAARVHDAGAVHVPFLARADGHHHGPRGVQRLQQRLGLVLREGPPTDEAELRTSAALDGDGAVGAAVRLRPLPAAQRQEGGGGDLHLRGAALLPPEVLPLLLGHEALLGGVLHGQLCGRALATAGAAALPRIRRAIHDLLGGKLAVGLVQLRVGAQRCGRGDRPTTAAWPLVRDVLHGAEPCLPREVRGERGQVELPRRHRGQTQA